MLYTMDFDVIYVILLYAMIFGHHDTICYGNLTNFNPNTITYGFWPNFHPNTIHYGFCQTFHRNPLHYGF